MRSHWWPSNLSSHEMKCRPLKNPRVAQLKRRIVEGKNKKSRCHRASRNVYIYIYTHTSLKMVSLRPKWSKPKFHHYSIIPVFFHQQPGTHFPILWSVFLCFSCFQTDTSASMMISKVVVPVTLILVTFLHTFTLPAVLDYSEPRSSRQVGSFPPRIIFWRMTINDPHGNLDNRPYESNMRNKCQDQNWWSLFLSVWDIQDV